MATTAVLEDMVGYRLGFTISATSVPTTTDVQSWLWEAAKKIAKKADPKFIEKLILTYVQTVDETLLLSSLTNYLRPLGFHIWYGVDQSLDKVLASKMTLMDHSFIEGENLTCQECGVSYQQETQEKYELFDVSWNVQFRITYILFISLNFIPRIFTPFVCQFRR